MEGDLQHLGALRLQSLESTQTTGAPCIWEGGVASLQLSFLTQQPLASHLTRLVTHTTHILDDGAEVEPVQSTLQCDLEHIAHLTNLRSLALAMHSSLVRPDSFAPLQSLTCLQVRGWERLGTVGMDLSLTGIQYHSIQVLSKLGPAPLSGYSILRTPGLTS